jgi:acyl carrier protein
MAQLSNDPADVVQAVVCEVLGVATVDAGTSFVDLGGVSLEAEQIALRLSARLGIEMNALDILVSESLKDIALTVRQRLADA